MINKIANSIIAAAMLSLFIACDKSDNLPNNPDSPVPSAQIIASEKLVIPVTVEVPTNSPGGTIRVATFYAEGVQKYKARTKPDNGSILEWVFVAPDASLYDISDKLVGTHGAGPFWRLSATDSLVAQQYSPVKSAPSPDGQSIDWLLLKPRTGTTPTGVFANVEYIQRIATKGGKAPATAPSSVTDTVSVKYIAVYRFTKAKL